MANPVPYQLRLVPLRSGWSFSVFGVLPVAWRLQIAWCAAFLGSKASKGTMEKISDFFSTDLGGGFKDFLLSPVPGEDSQFD